MTGAQALPEAELRGVYRAIRERNPEKARDAMRDHLVMAQRAEEAEEEIGSGSKEI